ncbi:MAG: xanthine dehydrogenase family protein molybdopterin-binding subunit, partial [Acidimicrobiales bacterium]
MSILGSRVLRVEDPRLLTVGGTYCADVRDRRLDGAVHATYVRSSVAHARVASVDVDAARILPGVVDVIVGGDVDLAPIPGWFNPGMVRTHLACDRVRFVGEPLAVVLTEHPDQGEDAVEAVAVDYEQLPTLTDPMAALTSEVKLFPEVGTNLVCEFGEPAHAGPDALDGCEVVVRRRLVNQRVAACPLEVRSSAAAWVDGRLHVWCSTQNPHAVRDALASLYIVDAGDVAVVAPDVGGGFGAKIDLHPEDLLLPWLARRCGRPVRWVESRSENLLAMVQGRAQVHDVAIGGRRDGTIEAYRLSIVQDAGAYPSMGAYLPMLTRSMAAGTYGIPAVEADARVVVTTTPPVGAYRGAGRPEATAAIERAVDLFAGEVAMDPVEVRRRNLVPRFDEPLTTPTGETYDCGDYPAALERVLLAAGYDELRAEQLRRRRQGDTMALGIGVAAYVEVTAGPSGGSEFARVEVQARLDAVGGPDGVDVVVATGASPHGQGHETTFAQIVANELGIPFEDVVVVHGDTAIVQYGMGTYGSR